MPEEIHRADTMAMSFKYFADGTKYSALDASGNGYMYVGAVRYAVRDGEAEVESLPFSAGRIVKTSNGYEPHYYLTDHLGSTRMIIGPDGETVNATFDYLAYGLEDSDSDSPTSTTEFRFSGKELLSNLSDLEIYDFGARLYLPRYGIWGGIDPLSEKYYALTPYAYCGNNPVARIDVDGRAWVNKKGYYIYKDGRYTKAATFVDRMLGNELNRTKTGREQFRKLIESPLPISIEISQEESKNLGICDLYENKMTGQILYAEITIYEKETSQFAKKNSIRAEQSMAATLGHEIEHTTPENIKLQKESKRKNINSSNTPVELAPNEQEPRKIKERIVGEYKELNSK